MDSIWHSFFDIAEYKCQYFQFHCMFRNQKNAGFYYYFLSLHFFVWILWKDDKKEKKNADRERKCSDGGWINTGVNSTDCNLRWQITSTG